MKRFRSLIALRNHLEMAIMMSCEKGNANAVIVEGTGA